MLLDQVEVLVQTDKLTTRIGVLELRLRTAGRDIPARPSLPADDSIQTLALLDAHKSKLEVLCKLTPTPADTAKAAPVGKAMTMTDICRAVNAGTMTVKEGLLAASKLPKRC